MARRLRMEYPGACYHVINRGNYRADVFGTEGAKAAFEACLFEACGKSGWVLHAFVIMRNHYHLAVETPEGNLGLGMQWLQATFANRFNRLRAERGHLFQGRYQALLVETESALGPVCQYIHLNPARAGIVPVVRLGEYRHGSYWYLRQPKARPGFLNLQTALEDAGGLPDAPAGWKRYAAYLEWAMAESPVGRNRSYVSLSTGWALGSSDYRARLIQEHEPAAEPRAWGREGAREIRAARWADTLARCLRRLGKCSADARADRKGAAWKAAIALRLKLTTQADNRWLAVQLHMGRPEAVSFYTSRLRRSRPDQDPDYQRLITIF